MTIFGILMIIGGGIALAYGNNLNNDYSAQLSSIFSSGSSDPGSAYMIIGGIVAVLGLILLIKGFMDNNQN